MVTLIQSRNNLLLFTMCLSTKKNEQDLELNQGLVVYYLWGGGGGGGHFEEYEKAKKIFQTEPFLDLSVLEMIPHKFYISWKWLPLLTRWTRLLWKLRITDFGCKSCWRSVTCIQFISTVVFVRSEFLQYSRLVHSVLIHAPYCLFTTSMKYNPMNPIAVEITNHWFWLQIVLTFCHLHTIYLQSYL